MSGEYTRKIRPGTPTSSKLALPAPKYALLLSLSILFQRLTSRKIEQFIESIFPSQDPTVIGQAWGKPVPPEKAEKAKDDAAARKELLYVFAAVIGTLLLLSLVMVSLSSAAF